ncbi:MAG TPA: thiamine biosynthesis protein, partial [Candidatus Bathyarchaeia archaeon]|nr:thiamine biosynthesis protein [Candidatus Bathyarchaeia archaeon]
EVTDPVLASSAIGLLFGVDRIAIAKEVEINFDSVVSTIIKTSRNLLLKGEKFYVKVNGKTSGYLAKDLEVSATASLIEQTVDLQVMPGSESDHSKMLYTHITESKAYVCIFVDKGLGGVPYNSQNAEILCCVYDELSAISCLQCIKMGFDVKILVCYSNDKDLLKISKMINRIIPSLIQEKIKLQFCKILRISNLLMKTLVITSITASVASRQKIPRVALTISPLVYPSWFIEENTKIISQKNLIPWTPLSGIDSSIIENAKEIGLEKYLTSLENLSKLKFAKKSTDKERIIKNVKLALKNLKSVSITLGSKNVHDIIDSLKANH